MKEFLSKYKLHVLVAVVGVVGLLWLNGTLKGCDVESVVSSASATSDTAAQPAFSPTTTVTPSSITSESTSTEEGIEN